VGMGEEGRGGEGGGGGLDGGGQQVGGAGTQRAVAYAGPVGDPRIGVRRKRAAALVVDQIMLEAERAQRVVERQQLEAAHAEHRADAVQLQHLGERAPAGHAPLPLRIGRHRRNSLARAATRRCPSSAAEMPISAPWRIAVSLTAVTKPSRQIDMPSPMRALQALTVAPAMPRASSAGRREMPTSSMPKSASLKMP